MPNDDDLESLFGPRREIDWDAPAEAVSAVGETTPYEATPEEMRQVAFLEWQAEQQAWEREQQAKAPEVLALLRQHIPADRLPDVEELLSTGFGADCLREQLRKD